MKQIFTLFSLFIISFISAQDCDGRYQADIFTDVKIDTVQFGSNITDGGVQQDLFMDIYTAVDDTLEEERPLVILAFGGSFIGGERTTGDMVFMATELAKKGYVAAAIDYRVTSSFLNLIQEENVVKVVFGAVQDGKAAIRFFRGHAIDSNNTYRIDTNNIFIGGTSAGGILAVNLAYVDDLNKLPETWQTWAADIGGIEGNSGNPGYCSRPNGVFSFAGAVGDTAWIEEDDIPHFGSHATGDMTVRYGFGPPLDNPLVTVPVSLYGSGNIESRLNNLGVYNELYTYSGESHPPFQGATTLETTKNNLTDFLFNILTCNPNNERKANQEDCKTFILPPSTVSIVERKIQKFISISPNPTSSFITITHQDDTKIKTIEIVDMVGSVILSKNLDENLFQLNVSELTIGTYVMNVVDENGNRDAQLFIKN